MPSWLSSDENFKSQRSYFCLSNGISSKLQDFIQTMLELSLNSQSSIARLVLVVHSDSYPLIDLLYMTPTKDSRDHSYWDKTITNNIEEISIYRIIRSLSGSIRFIPLASEIS